MNNKWFAQCVFLVCHRWGRMFVLMIFAPGYVDWGWIFSETSWRVQCGSLAWCLWSSAGMYGLYGIITQQTCHVFCACVCFFGYQLSKFGKQTFELKADGETYAPFAIYNRALEQLWAILECVVCMFSSKHSTDSTAWQLHHAFHLHCRWNRRLGTIDLVRKSMAIHVDNCYIASGKGTMPVYPIVFEMDLVSARCGLGESGELRCERQGRFVSMFLSSSLWSTFVILCLYCGVSAEGGCCGDFQERGMEPSLATPVSTLEFAKHAFRRPFTTMIIYDIWYMISIYVIYKYSWLVSDIIYYIYLIYI